MRAPPFFPLHSGGGMFLGDERPIRGQDQAEFSDYYHLSPFGSGG
jgi:hypothetical protein